MNIRDYYDEERNFNEMENIREERMNLYQQFEAGKIAAQDIIDIDKKLEESMAKWKESLSKILMKPK